MTLPLTRREFLRASSLTVAGLCVAGAEARAAELSGPPALSDPMGVLVDLTRCIGCRSCVRACETRNGLRTSGNPGSAWEAGPQVLTHDQWTVVNLMRGRPGREPVPVKRQCMHCLHPVCVSVCPVGALIQRSDGAVVYRQERCIGCR